MSAVVVEALNRVADRIERDPSVYDYELARVPEGSRAGCMLGLLGQELGFAPGTLLQKVSRRVLGLEELDFYRKMADVVNCGLPAVARRGHRTTFTAFRSPALMAQALRVLARDPVAITSLFQRKYALRERVRDLLGLCFPPAVA